MIAEVLPWSKTRQRTVRPEMQGPQDVHTIVRNINSCHLIRRFVHSTPINIPLLKGTLKNDASRHIGRLLAGREVSGLLAELEKIRLEHGFIVPMGGRVTTCDCLIQSGGKNEPTEVGNQ